MPRRGTQPERRLLPEYDAGEIVVVDTIHGFVETIDRDTTWAVHSHPTHELIWNDEGSSTITVDRRTWTVTPFAGLWIPAGVRHSAFTPAGTRYRTAHFGFGVVPTLSDDPATVELTPLLRLLLERAAEPGLSAGSRAATETLILDVLRPADREIVVRTPVQPLLAPVAAVLLADPADGRTLAQWSAELGVSARTLTRAFVADTGLGYGQWVAAVRAQRAVALLLRGLDPEDVARATGYASVSAFGAAFRRVTGRTPGAFRPGRIREMSVSR